MIAKTLRKFRDPEAKFYVYAGSESRWLIDAICDTEEDAVADARRLLGTGLCAAVKVVREGGRFAEKEIFRADAPAPPEDRPAALAPVDEVPLCRDLEDFYGYDAARTLGRFLRNYLDAELLTAHELLYGAAHLKRLMLKDTLFNALVQRAAAVQARSTGERPLDRLDALHKAADLVRKRAANARPEPLLALIDRAGLAAMVEAAHAESPADAGFLAGAALAAYTGRSGSFEAKLLALLALAETCREAPALRHLDEFIAIVLESGKAVREILGWQASTGEALSALIDVAAGRRRPDGKLPALDRLGAICGRAPLTRAALLERVERALGGTTPLSRDGSAAERTGLAKIARALTQSGSFVGGAGMAEALGRRARLVLGNGHEDMPVKEALDAVLGMLPSRAIRASYLLELSTTRLAARHDPDILACFAEFMGRIAQEAATARSEAVRRDIMAVVTAIAERLRSGQLNGEWSALLARETARLLQGCGAADAA